MTYSDGHHREMAKWAHDRIERERQEAEQGQRRTLADLDEPTNSNVTQVYM